MSQNKTVIQGLEPDDAPSNYRNVNSGASSSFYTRGGRTADPRGTIVPGMMGTPSNVANLAGDAQPHQPSQKTVVSGKPIVGFLYSISRTPAGEFWPLHVGQNTIGKSPSCDISLPEGTVSSDHAVLVVRKMKNPEKVIASISDARSTNGTMLNGVSLAFTAEECKNGDIITIGDNYELYLVLLDAATLGLSVAKNFIPIEEQTDEILGPDELLEPGFTKNEQDFQMYSGYTQPNGTIGLDGSGPQGHGGTIGM